MSEHEFESQTNIIAQVEEVLGPRKEIRKESMNHSYECRVVE